MPRHVLAALALLIPLSACGQPSSERLAARVDSLAAAATAEVVFVEGGPFLMGDAGVRFLVARTAEVDSLRGDPALVYWTPTRDARPAHEVDLSSFSIQSYEVTYDEYDLFTAATGRPTTAPSETDRGRRPALVRTRDDAQAYCLWLGEQTGLAFDLPTEAQWEYAARSRGRPVGFASDTGALDPGRNIAISEVADWSADPDSVEAQRAAVVSDPEIVGTYPPNPLGLYDMSANAYELVLDWFEPGYDAARQRDPTGPAQGDRWTVRGGANLEDIGGATVYSRFGVPADGARVPRFGFRCVVNRATAVAASPARLGEP